MIRQVVLAACLAIAVALPQWRSSDENFIGAGTRDLAKALLQGFVNEEENMVYSPLGYSSVLAIFAEGAKGDSRDEIATALHFPKDVNAVREAYKSVLEKLTGKREPNTPEFQNYFYVYKNYTVEEELKQILMKYYLTDVRTVDRPDDYIKTTNEESNKSDVKTEVTPDERTKEETTEEPEMAESTDVVVEETTRITEKDEVMVAMQRSFSGTDHFSGMTDSSLKIRGEGPHSRMIIFNGLYFKGDWKVPFVKKPADDSRVFYKSEKEKISVSTIRSEGEFLTGSIPNLDCRAIELPYQGDRYSLLILVPNARDGLRKLISDLSVYPITDIYEQMSTKPVSVGLPSFSVDYISKPISSFSKLGLSKVTSIFDPEKADLSGVSKEPGLYVEELVQMVSFKVDADYSNANFLSSSAASSRSNFANFEINQPFLFFLKDKVDDMIVVNGKLLDPTPKPDFFDS